MKAARARSAQDSESWNEGGVCPTLNVFDNNGDTRATVIIAYNLHSGSKRQDRPDGGFYVNETDVARTLDASGGLDPSKNDGGVAIVQEIDVENPILMRQREGKPGGGKGPLMSENKSLTIAVANDQVLFQPVTATGDVTHALTAEGADASEDGTGRGTPIIATAIGFQPTDGGFANYNDDDRSTTLKASDAPAVATATIVRRLTPTECERLQGFPDGWTAQRIDQKTGAVVDQKDSARYKQMGNAVAVPCVEWIMRRLLAVDTEMSR